MEEKSMYNDTDCLRSSKNIADLSFLGVPQVLRDSVGACCVSSTTLTSIAWLPRGLRVLLHTR